MLKIVHFKSSLLCLMLLFAAMWVDADSDIQQSRRRVIVSTDIGGTDPDDFQSMVHLLLYSDVLEIEGLIASPYGPGRKHHILSILDLYEKDFENLQTYSSAYPTANQLRSITRQGAIESAPYPGVSLATQGSDWIITCARRNDSRPLFVLIWGGIDDLAQALHDAPDILPKLRVFYIGGPNKKWCPDAYQYLVENFPELWIIESNSTYRGWFTGGDQNGGFGNQTFVREQVKNNGHMGGYFDSHLQGTIKMGDTPSVAWLLSADNPEDPTSPSWGGSYVRAWKRPHVVFDRLTSGLDRIEIFSIMELRLSTSTDTRTRTPEPEAFMVVENQQIPGFFDAQRQVVCFRFSPKSAKVFPYRIESNMQDLAGRKGEVTVYPTPPDSARSPDPATPNWWTDDPSPLYAEGEHHGAKTVSRWRREYLTDFAARMKRCEFPKTPN